MSVHTVDRRFARDDSATGGYYLPFVLLERQLGEGLGDASGQLRDAMLTRADDQADALIREYVDREVTGRLADLLDTPDAAFRAGMVNVQLLGLAVARYVVRIEPIASAPADELVSRFGPLVQQCLTEGG
ncbi:hypothetical protein ACFXPA_27530 [Amycolatopsis sp. NPDC059090]|uniref:TetR/AcrR family transcriptional regulator n=1 Tax=unclassified Amycolatopsis TaxID=2618356 RepID=UPI00366BFFAB